MKIKKLLEGLVLTQVSLACGATAFEFSGKKDGKYYEYALSTMFEICFEPEHIFIRDITDDESTIMIWRFLDKKLKCLKLSDDSRVCELGFGDGQSIFVWSKELKHDNLFVATNKQTKNWLTIG